MPERPVKDILKRDAAIEAGPDRSVLDAARLMAEHRCGSVIVCHGGEIVGIFTERDLLTRVVAAERDVRTTTLGEVMTPRPDRVEMDTPLKDAVRMMDEFGYRHLPVVEAATLKGVISMRDVPWNEIARLEPELDDRHALAERMW